MIKSHARNKRPSVPIMDPMTSDRQPRFMPLTHRATFSVAGSTSTGACGRYLATSLAAGGGGGIVYCGGA